jgi:hypothetical protein
VSTPVPGALAEAALFLERLAASGLVGDALVLNRVYPRSDGSVTRRAAGETAAAFGLDPALADTLLVALADEDAQGAADAAALREFEQRTSSAGSRALLSRIELPLLAGDPHDLAHLSPLSLRLV